MLIYIGTSGFQYDFWKGNFYPKNLKPENYLEYYSNFFNCIEINYTFYRSPDKKIIDNWFYKTPKNFKFIIKMNSYITHYKKLSNIDNDLKKFLKIITYLKHKLLCILFQFNRNFVYNQTNINKLKHLYTLLPKKLNYAFEFRHFSWFNINSYILFKHFNWSIVISHYSKYWKKNIPGFNPKLSKFILTSKFVYFRLHGTSGLYTGSYSNKILSKILKFIKKNKIKIAYIIFNNTDSINLEKNLPDAIFDALRMKTLLNS